MIKQHKLADKSVIILLAPGFAETETAHYISYMRENKIPVSLVGLSAQQVSGTHGLSFHPDCSLNQLPCQKNHPLVLMLGGYDYLASLMADPRVHQLLDDAEERNAIVAADETAATVIPYTNAKFLLKRQNFITQKDMNQDEFAHYLVQLVQKEPLLI